MAMHAEKCRIIVSTCLLVLLTVSCGKALVFTEYFADRCGDTVDIMNTGGEVDSQQGVYYSNDFDCTVTFSTSIGRKILITFDRVKIMGDTMDCKSSDFLEVFDGVDMSMSLGVICGEYVTPDALTSSGNSITFQFKTNSSVTSTGYKFAYTSFSEYTSATPCEEDEFKCNNDRCISDSLTIDFNDNCGDNSDEDSSVYTDLYNNAVGLLQWGIGVLIAIIVGIIVAVVLLCVCMGCLCYHCCCKKTPQPQYTGVVQTGGPPVYNQQPPMAMQQTAPQQQYGQPAQI